MGAPGESGRFSAAMKSPSDPIRSLALQIGAIVVIGVLSLSVFGWWLTPGEPEDSLSGWAPVPLDPPRQDAPLALDLALFEKRLTPAAPPLESPPAEPTLEPTPPPPPPLRVAYTLIGLVESKDGALAAVVYDQDLDQLRTVTQGEALGQFNIAAITPKGVTLVQADRLARLDLDPVEDAR